LESILEDRPNKKYDCSEDFVSSLKNALGGELKKIHGIRLIDTRHGNSLHSWDLGIKGKCPPKEVEFMNLLISNRRKHEFGTHQDGKALSLSQIKTFYKRNDIQKVISSLLKKGYLKVEDGKFNPVCGNMSFEVFKFLDPKTISITLTASDSNRLGVFHKGRVRRITPRECARLQGYPENYKLHPTDSVAYKQFGNAVSVPVIGRLLEDYFENNPSSILKKKHKIGKRAK
jgi:DNA (cytosine-5)-methyltransferase 1